MMVGRPYFPFNWCRISSTVSSHSPRFNGNFGFTALSIRWPREGLKVFGSQLSGHRVSAVFFDDLVFFCCFCSRIHWDSLLSKSSFWWVKNWVHIGYMTISEVVLQPFWIPGIRSYEAISCRNERKFPAEFVKKWRLETLKNEDFVWNHGYFWVEFHTRNDCFFL